MKSKFLFILFYFFTLLIFTQNESKKIYIEYAVEKGQISSTEYLIAESNKALYTTDFIKFNNESNSLKKDEFNNFTIQQKNIRINSMKYYTSLSSPFLYFVSQYPKTKKIIIALDSVPKINWKLNSKKTKKINKFTCFKATAMFRGSKIIAYYTPEIPVEFGPFKFKGLPGLILEVYNKGKGVKPYSWKAKKIIFPYPNKDDLSFSSNLYNAPIVSYRSVVEQFENKMKKISETIFARNSRGSTSTLIKSERTGIEKKYEWEKEK